MLFFQTTPAAVAICIAMVRTAFTSSLVAPFLMAPSRCHPICRGVSMAISAEIIAKDVSIGEVAPIKA